MEVSSGKPLDPARRSFESRDFEGGLRRKIVGQDEAVQAVVDLYQVFRAGLNSPGRPVGNLLFLGPTGAGKTRVVEATAEVLFGDPRAVIKIDCAEFQHSQVDRVSSGIPRSPRDTPADHARGTFAISHREIEDQLFALRRNREGVGLALAVAFGNSRQSHTHARGQPASGSIADDDFHDVESRRQRDHRVDDGRDGFCADGAAGIKAGSRRKSGADGVGSGEAEILP
jgi:hypothetical protein